MINHAGQLVAFAGHLTEAKVGKTGLVDVTCDVFRLNLSTGVVTQVVTGGACFPIGGGMYGYIYLTDSTAASIYYFTSIKTATTSVDQQEVVALQIAGTLLTERIDAATSGIPALVWGVGTRTLTGFGTLVADVTTSVWAAGARTLTGFGTLSSDVATAVWGAGTRTLTGFGTLVGDIWAALTSGLTTPGSIGKLLTDNVNIPINSRAAAGDAMALTAAERTATGTAVWASEVIPYDAGNDTPAVSAKTQLNTTAFNTGSYGALQTVGAAIKLKTDNLPANTSTEVAAIKGVTTKLDAMIVADGPVFQFDANALELSPAAPTAAAVSTAVWSAASRTLTAVSLVAGDVEFTFSMSPVRFASWATQTVKLRVEATRDGRVIDETQFSAEIAFKTSKAAAPVAADWKPLSWDADGYATILVGAAGAVTLAKGDYFVAVRITNAPEVSGEWLNAMLKIE